MRYSWFDSTTDYIVTIRKNGGTDAKYEMETWGNPDTNRTAVTNLMGFGDIAKRDSDVSHSLNK